MPFSRRFSAGRLVLSFRRPDKGRKEETPPQKSLDFRDPPVKTQLCKVKGSKPGCREWERQAYSVGGSLGCGLRSLFFPPSREIALQLLPHFVQ